MYKSDLVDSVDQLNREYKFDFRVELFQKRKNVNFFSFLEKMTNLVCVDRGLWSNGGLYMTIGIGTLPRVKSLLSLWATLPTQNQRDFSLAVYFGSGTSSHYGSR